MKPERRSHIELGISEHKVKHGNLLSGLLKNNLNMELTRMKS